jgi:putative phosphoesterase
MRIAVISDIHSNLPALEAVKEEIERSRAEKVVCAGDVVGYGGSPNECCRIVAGLARNACLGNHDLAALRRDPSGMNPYAARAVIWTAETLDEASRRYLKTLGKSSLFEDDGVAFAVHHGSLRSIWEYLYEEDINEGMLNEAGVHVLVLGHTHIPYVMTYADGLVMNPGSVGQPRDGDPRASLAILDTRPLRCEIRRVEYDIEEATESIRTAGLPDMLAERLRLGY